MRRIQRKGVQRYISLCGIAAPRHLAKDVRRQNAEYGMTMPARAAIRLHDDLLYRLPPNVDVPAFGRGEYARQKWY
jgi:hypothetical protein